MGLFNRSQPVDQTSFSAGAAAAQDVQMVQKDARSTSSHMSEVAELPLTPMQKFTKNKFAILISGSVLLCFLIILTALSSKGMPPEAVVQPSPTPVVTVKKTEKTDYQKQLMDLRQHVTDAEPGLDDLPVPPIAGDLYIDEKIDR
jgi:hypothetical protein